MLLSDFQLERAVETRDGYVRYSALDAQQQVVEIHLFRNQVRELPEWNTLVKRARLAAMVSHDAVQRFLAVELQQEVPLLILEWLPGPNLVARQASGPLPLTDVLQLGSSIAAGLVQIHRLGMAHGGVSPARIVRRTDDRWSLAWPSWNQSVDRESYPDKSETGQETHPARNRATHFNDHDLQFLAPEQRGTADVETASDVFGLAGVLQCLLTDRDQELGSLADSWRKIFAECRADDPTLRPTASQLSVRLSALLLNVARTGPLFEHCSNATTLVPDKPLQHASVSGRAVDATMEISVQEFGVATPKQLGRYEIGEKLGEGGMGAVFRGRDLSDGMVVAVKVLSTRFVAEPASRRRFAKEARMLAQVNNPFVANLLAFDEDAGAAYLAIEFVPGGSVGECLKLRGAFSEKMALALVADALRGLAVAHQRGIVHRDIKPDNMLLTEAGTAFLDTPPGESPRVGVPLVKLADFGLARKEQQSESLAITHDGTLLGTPWYMSPEQCRGLPTDTRSDVYSMGATLFHLITGRPPFEGASHVAVMNQHCQNPPPELRKLRPETTESLERVVGKSLAKNRDARYATASEFLADLENLLRGSPTSIGLHPRRPETGGKQAISFEFHWDLSSTPAQIWPYVSNTDRVNQGMGLPPIKYTTQVDPVLGVRRFAEVLVAGQRLQWEEHPYEWVEGRKMSVLREFSGGPFRWFINVVELQPGVGGGTRLKQTFQLLPLGRLGRWLAQLEIGWKAKKSLTRVYQQIDQYLSSDGRHDPATDAFRKATVSSAARRARLRQRLERLSALRLNPMAVETLGQFLEHGADQEVARIRPLAFAERFGLPSADAIDVCLQGAREGLLVLLWDILCPSCRIPADVKETLAALQDHGHCAACNLDFDLDFGNSVEVIFRIHPEIRPVETRTYCIGGPAFSSHVVAQTRLAPAERFEMELALEEGAYRIRGPQFPFVVDVRVAARGVVGRWELALSRPLLPELIPVLQCGSQVVTLVNDTPRDQLVRLERTASRQDALTAAAASSLALFREVFPDQVLTPGQMVSVTAVNLLLARIHESAAMYRRLGDGAAFQRVRQLLDLGTQEVATHGGAVVKVVGDGLFAVFNDSAAAVRTALKLFGAAKEKLPDVALQLAIHAGPAMVATMNDRLDYFGRSVHLVHELATRSSANEMLISDTVASLPGVARLLREAGFAADILAGVRPDGRIIYRCRAGGGSEVVRR